MIRGQLLVEAPFEQLELPLPLDVVADGLASDLLHRTAPERSALPQGSSLLVGESQRHRYGTTVPACIRTSGVSTGLLSSAEPSTGRLGRDTRGGPVR